MKVALIHIPKLCWFQRKILVLQKLKKLLEEVLVVNLPEAEVAEAEVAPLLKNGKTPMTNSITPSSF
jgi:hypothetical protein